MKWKEWFFTFSVGSVHRTCSKKSKEIFFRDLTVISNCQTVPSRRTTPTRLTACLPDRQALSGLTGTGEEGQNEDCYGM